MSKLSAAFDRFLDFTGAIPGIMVAIMSLGVTAEVFSRTFGLGGFFWMLDVVEYGLLFLTMAGAAYLMNLGRHVTVDLVPNMLPAKLRRRVDILINFLIVVICFVIVYYSIIATLASYNAGSYVYKSFDFKEWIPLSWLPIGMSLFTLVCIRRFFRVLMGSDASTKRSEKLNEVF